MLKAYKYRLYPNNRQINIIERTFGCARKVWNLMLADKIAHYNETGKSLTVTPAKYKRMAEYAYLKEVDSLALANVQLDLQDAYKSFFDRIKKARKRDFQSSRAKKQVVSLILRITKEVLCALKTVKSGCLKLAL